MAHTQDPQHRVECRDFAGQVRVTVGDAVLADTTRAVLLSETSYPERYYLPPEDLRSDVLVESDSHTFCPYKGVASYWSFRGGNGEEITDVGWTYAEALGDALPIQGMVCFYPEKVEVTAVPEGHARRRMEG